MRGKGGHVSLLPCSADNILTWITLHTIVKYDGIFVLLIPMFYQCIMSNYLQIHKQHLLQKTKKISLHSPTGRFWTKWPKKRQKNTPISLGGMISDSLMKITFKPIV